MSKAVEKTLLTDGHVVFREGQPASKVYLITQGEVELLKNTGKALEPISTCRIGDFIGTNTLIDDENYHLTARVKTMATVVPIEKDDVCGKLSKLDKLTLNIIKSVILRSNRILDEK